jgi:hypothetical protein
MLKITKTIKYLSITALAVLVLFGSATPAFAAFSQVLHSFTAGGAASSVTTGNLTTTGADLLIVAVTDYQASTLGSVSDNKSNTWTQLTSRNDGAVARVTFWYAKNATVGSNHTFTYNGCGGTCYPTIYVQAWSGSDLTAPFDVENGASGAAISSLATGSVTPNQANSLLLAATNPWTVSISSIDSSFTIDDSRAYNPGFEFAGAVAYLVQGSAAAVNPTFTYSGSTAGAAAVIAAFKPATGGGGSPAPARRRSPSPQIID